MNLQFVWWGWRWGFGFHRYRPETESLALIYAWGLGLGPVEVRRWRHSRYDWIPVEKAIPQCGLQKPADLGWLTTDGRTMTAMHTHPSYWNHRDPRGREFNGPVVTHWMPLPPLPDATEAREEREVEA